MGTAAPIGLLNSTKANSSEGAGTRDRKPHSNGEGLEARFPGRLQGGAACSREDGGPQTVRAGPPPLGSGDLSTVSPRPQQGAGRCRGPSSGEGRNPRSAEAHSGRGLRADCRLWKVPRGPTVPCLTRPLILLFINTSPHPTWISLNAAFNLLSGEKSSPRPLFPL